MAPESKEKTAFVTPDGHYQFGRMPFGLANGPAVFQRLINRILGPLRYNIVLAYLDDVLIPSETVEEGINHLRQVLVALRGCGLTLNPRKCHLLVDRIQYLGFEISGDGIGPSHDKVGCIVKYPRPINVHNVRQFLGLTSYFRRFIKDYAIKSKHMTLLLRKDCEWSWNKEQEDAFVALKESMATQPVLALYSPHQRTELHTDASAIGLGGILLQEKRDGCLQDNIRQDQVRQRLRYNKRRCNSDTLAEGDLVLWRREASATGEPRKLLEKYKGPYVIIESLPGEGIASRDALKRYHPYNDTEDSETSSNDSGDMICDKAEYSARSDQKSVGSVNMNSEKAEYSACSRQIDVDNEIGENSETKQEEYPTREKVTRRQRTIKRPQRYLD
ncbi:Reverse transcriptase (RNA-dependent DNA polymerase) [Popillia japonica]|uniref:RNA-directed DNA polymerase n=1 Tax=Popillia japonica TaxID=7064 RepID=A0AAW1L8W9_POPJA